MDQKDNRVHTRAQYFLLPGADGNAPVPVYSLRAAGDTLSVPGLVVDMSDGGLQILTSSRSQLADPEYSLEIVVSEELRLERQRVRQVWSRPDGVNTRTGFAFVEQGSHVDRMEQLLRTAEMRLLRCVLHPLAGE